jgi:prefoldin subunit 5
MYLEERIEQVEKQNETTARAVADLTVDVRAIRRDQNEGFRQINGRLDKVESNIVELKQDVAELKQDVGMIKQTLHLVLAYLHEKLP